jgi:hypothetical protein
LSTSARGRPDHDGDKDNDTVTNDDDNDDEDNDAVERLGPCHRAQRCAGTHPPVQQARRGAVLELAPPVTSAPPSSARWMTCSPA